MNEEKENVQLKEVRKYQMVELEIKETDEKQVLTGYAMEWGSKSRPIVIDDVEFIETFLPTAFDTTLKDDTQLILYDHNIANILGRTDKKTAFIESDDKGLRVTVHLPKTTLGKDVLEMVERGDIEGLSVGFIPLKEEYNEDYDYEKGKTVLTRTIKEAVLLEISLVVIAAYQSSSISKRDYNGMVTKVEEMTKKKQEEIEREELIKNLLISTLEEV